MSSWMEKVLTQVSVVRLGDRVVFGDLDIIVTRQKFFGDKQCVDGVVVPNGGLYGKWIPATSVVVDNESRWGNRETRQCGERKAVAL